VWRTRTDAAFICGSSWYLKIQNDLNSAWTFRGVCWWPWTSKHLICWWTSSLLRSSRTQTWYQVHTKLHLGLKIRLASQNLTKAYVWRHFTRTYVWRTETDFCLRLGQQQLPQGSKWPQRLLMSLGSFDALREQPLDTRQLGVSTLDLNVCWCPLAASTHFGNTSRYTAVGSLKWPQRLLMSLGSFHTLREHLQIHGSWECLDSGPQRLLMSFRSFDTSVTPLDTRQLGVSTLDLWRSNKQTALGWEREIDKECTAFCNCKSPHVFLYYRCTATNHMEKFDLQ